MNRAVFVLRRLLLLVPVLLGLSMVTFTLSNVVADPVAAWISDRTPQAVIEQIRKQHHFDDPIYIQYFYYLSDLLKGDWGLSKTSSNEPVVRVLQRLFPATIELALATTLFQLVVGLPLGIISALKKDKALDHASRLLAMGGTSFPAFWLALLMQLVFFYYLQLYHLPYLPSAGQVSDMVLTIHPLRAVTGFVLVDSLLTWNIPVFQDALVHIIMPAIVLGFDGLGILVRISRSSMLEVLRQDYITLARAKGLSERVVIYRHALRNAMNPIITIMGLVFGFTLSGAPVVETVFSWPGVGRWAALAIVSLDRASIMGFVLVAGTIYILVNLAVDLLYAITDPRVRYGR